MQNTLGNIHTKFCSNWSSSFREELWKKNVDYKEDNDGRQVMAIALTILFEMHAIVRTIGIPAALVV